MAGEVYKPGQVYHGGGTATDNLLWELDVCKQMNADYAAAPIATPPPPMPIGLVPLDTTGANVVLNTAGEVWYEGHQVASITQIGGGKGPLDDWVANNVSWWNLPGQVVYGTAANPFRESAWISS